MANQPKVERFVVRKPRGEANPGFGLEENRIAFLKRSFVTEDPCYNFSSRLKRFAWDGFEASAQTLGRIVERFRRSTFRDPSSLPCPPQFSPKPPQTT